MASWDDIPIDSESSFELARKENLDVRVADEYTLQLDCDDEGSVSQFRRYEPRLRAHFGVKEITETKSRHDNTHIYVTLENPMTVPERIALQAALGSDPTREFLSLKRWLDKDPNPILLFEVKPKPKEL